MARIFVPASVEYLSNSSLGLVTPLSVHSLVKQNSVDGQVCIWSSADSGDTENRHMLIAADAAGGTGPDTPPHLGCHTTAGAWGDADNSVAAVAMSNSGLVWESCGGVWASASSRRSYFKGVGSTERTTTVSPTSIDRTFIGRLADSTPNWEWDGHIAHVAVWNVALTSAEMLMLARRVSPFLVRPGSLIHYWPITGVHSPELDLVGGFHMTVEATPDAANDPVIYAPQKQIFVFAPAAGAAPAFSAAPIVQDNDDVSFTLAATADADSTWYAVAVLTGQTAPTATQIKAGNATGDVAAEAAANTAVLSAVADTLVVGSALDLPLYDIYSVLNNAGGDSSVDSLIGKFLDPVTGKQFQTVTILDVSSVTQADPPVVTTDAAHGFSTGQLIRPYGGDMTEFDATHANYTGDKSPTPDDGKLYFQITVLTSTTFELDDLNSTGWDAYTGGADCPAGFSFFEGASPAVIDNDIWEADLVTTGDVFSVTLFPDGTLTYDAGGSAEQQRIEMRVYDVSAEVWTANVTQYFNNTEPSLKEAFPNPVRFKRSIAFDLSPIKDVFVEDVDSDALTLTSLSGQPTSIVIGGGDDSIEGTTTAVASTDDTMTLRVTDAPSEFTDFNITYDVIETATMPDVDDEDKTEATAISDITGAGLQSPTVIYQLNLGVTVGNVFAQTPAASTVYAVDETTTITVATAVDLGGIPADWHSIPNSLKDIQFRALMVLEADGAGVWASWRAGTDVSPRGSSNVRLNLSVIKQEADTNSTWARWAPGTQPGNTGNLQLNMIDALNAAFVVT